MPWWGYVYIAISFVSFVVSYLKTKRPGWIMMIFYAVLFALWPIYMVWSMFVAYKRIQMIFWIADRYMEKGGVIEREIALDMAKAGLDWAVDNNGLDGPPWAWDRGMANELADTDMSYWDQDAG